MSDTLKTTPIVNITVFSCMFGRFNQYNAVVIL